LRCPFCILYAVAKRDVLLGIAAIDPLAQEDNHAIHLLLPKPLCPLFSQCHLLLLDQTGYRL